MGDGSVTTLSENAVISGGTCNVDAARGGNVFIEGTFTMNGGSVANGSAGWGSNIMGMVGGAAGKLLKSPLMLAVKPFTLRQLLDLPMVNLNPEMVEMIEDYLGTIQK